MWAIIVTERLGSLGLQDVDRSAKGTYAPAQSPLGLASFS